MSIIIRLQNLPWAADSTDIRRYFSGLSIPEGGVHIVGGEMGDAFIAFSTDEDARLAMAKDNGKIHEMQIKLLLSSRTEMTRVIEKARQQNLTLQATQVVAPIQPPPFPNIANIQQLQQPIRTPTPVENERRRGRSPTPPRRRSRERMDSRDRRRSPDNRRTFSKRDRSRSPSRSSRGSIRDMDNRDRRNDRYRRDDRRYPNEESSRDVEDRHSDRYRYAETDRDTRRSQTYPDTYQEQSHPAYGNFQDPNIARAGNNYSSNNPPNMTMPRDYPANPSISTLPRDYPSTPPNSIMQRDYPTNPPNSAMTRDYPNNLTSSIQRDYPPNPSSSSMQKDYPPNSSNSSMQRDYPPNSSNSSMQRDYPPNSLNSSMQRDCPTNSSNLLQRENPFNPSNQVQRDYQPNPLNQVQRDYPPNPSNSSVQRDYPTSHMNSAFPRNYSPDIPNSTISKDYPDSANTRSNNYDYNNPLISAAKEYSPPRVPQNSNYSYNNQTTSPVPKEYQMPGYYSNPVSEVVKPMVDLNSNNQFSMDKGNMSIMQTNALTSNTLDLSAIEKTFGLKTASAEKITTPIIPSNPTQDRKRKSRFEPETETPLQPPFIPIPEVLEKLGVKLQPQSLSSSATEEKQAISHDYQPVKRDAWSAQSEPIKVENWKNTTSSLQTSHKLPDQNIDLTTKQKNSGSIPIPMELDPLQESPNIFVGHDEQPKQPLIQATARGNLRSNNEDSQKKSSKMSVQSSEGDKWRGPATLTVEVLRIPYDTRMEDLLYLFRSIQLHPTNVCIQANNQRAERAFIRFNNTRDFEEAMRSQPVFIRNSQCGLMPCSPTAFDNAVAAQVSKPQPKMKPREEDLVVQLKGLPFQCNEDDVIKFFDGLHVLDTFLEMTPYGKCSGLGFVEFAAVRDFRDALTLNGKTIGHRYITISVSSKEIFEFHRDKNAPSSNSRPSGPPSARAHPHPSAKGPLGPSAREVPNQASRELPPHQKVREQPHPSGRDRPPYQKARETPHPSGGDLPPHQNAREPHSSAREPSSHGTREQSYPAREPPNHAVKEHSNLSAREALNPTPQGHPHPAPREHPHSASREHPHPAPREHPHPASREHPHPAPREHPHPAPREHPHPAPREHPHPAPREHPPPSPREHPHPAPRERPHPPPRERPYPDPRERPYPDPRERPFPAPRERPHPALREQSFSAARESTSAMNNKYGGNRLVKPPDNLMDDQCVAPPSKPIRGNFCISIQGLPKSVNNENLGNFFKEMDVSPLGIHVIVDSNEGPTGQAYVEFATQREIDIALSKNIPFHGCRIIKRNLPIEELDEIIGRTPLPPPTGLLLRPDPSRKKPLLAQAPTEFRDTPSLDYPREGLVRSPGSMRPGRPPMNRPMRPPMERPMRPPMGRMRGPRPVGPDRDPVPSFGPPGCVVGINNLHFSAGLEDILSFFKGFKVTKDSINRRYNENNQPTGEARVCFENPREAIRAVRELDTKCIMNRSLKLFVI